LTPAFLKRIFPCSRFPGGRGREFSFFEHRRGSGIEQTRPTTPKPHTHTMPEPLTTGAARNHLHADVEIKGSIKFQSDLTIDGKLEGEITSPGHLTVGASAEIRGEIKTKSVTVDGKVHGNITVDERCELKARAALHGDLKAARLVIEEGATFVGKSEVTPNRIAMKQPEVLPNPQKQQAQGGR
jgi:cytoskeletal protein CcmA (bactofilin family)